MYIGPMKFNSLVNKFYLILSLFLSVNYIASSQYHFTRNITLNDGLPSNSIQAIFKDSRGYYWIGTEAGLCRFDGISFKTFTQQDGLPGNRIWSITEDCEGNLWFACYGNGISKFDGRTFHNHSSKNGLVNDNVRKVEYSAKNKGLLIGTEFGFSFFKDSTFTSFQDKSITTRDLMQVTDFLDCDTVIYIFTYYDSQQFIEFKPATRTFKYLPKNHRYHFKSNKTTCSHITSKQDTIIGDFIHGVKIYKKDSIIMNNSLGQVFDITEDKERNLWIASWNDGNIGEMKARGGIYKLNNYKAEYFGDYLGINSHKCWCLYYDENENVLWVGTLDKGLYLYPMAGIEYTPASVLNPDKPLLRDILIDSKGKLWISIGDKIVKKDTLITTLNAKLFQNRYNNYVSKKYSFLNDPREFNKLVNTRITDFYKFNEDIRGRLLINSNAGIFHLNSDSLYISHYELQEGISYFIEPDNVFSILAQYDLTRFSMPDFKPIENIRLRKSATYSSFCHYLKDQDVFWFYNNTDGIFKYQSGKLTKFNNLESRIDLSVSSLCKDRQNNLIAGTNSGNIYILNFQDDSIKVVYRITEQDGIAGTDIRWVLTDNNNCLWFGTNKGLNVLDLNRLYNEGKKEVLFFNEENGFFDKQSTKAILDASGNILVMSGSNLFRFNPDELIKSTYKVSKLKIENIEVNFNKYEWSAKTKVDKWTGIPETNLVLPYDRNTLTFYFHLLQFNDPSKAQYSYKLEGSQDNWTPFSPETKAVFTNLGDKKYTLRIRGKLISSPDLISEIEYSFQILPPWYRTWWFYCTIFLIVSSIIYFILRNRFRAIKRKSDIDRRISELKMEALKSQMNPHFIFNAFNSIQKYILQQDTKAALDYMSEFALLIRQTLDNSTKNLISLSDEKKYLTSYLSLEKRRIMNLTYSIVITPDIDQDEIFFPPMLLQPFVENSILHGIRHLEREGKIVIQFTLTHGDSCLICSIEDNGIGRKKANEINEARDRTHKSQGTQNTFQRLALLGIQAGTNDLYDNEGLATGTKVELKIQV